MWEMGTQRLKRWVCKNIGKNIGILPLPTMATYLVKDQVEKWGVEVVEDTSKYFIKFRFMYVVISKRLHHLL